MKNKFYYLVLVFAIFLFTGCGKKNLNCSIEYDYGDGMSISKSLNFIFLNDKLRNTSMHEDIKYYNDDEVRENSVINSITEFSDLYKNEHGIDYTIESNDDSFIFDLNLAFNKMNTNTKENFYLINYKKSYSSTKAEFEASGYICN